METKQRQNEGKTGDLNFCFPLDLSKLVDGKVRLVAFESDFNTFSSLYVEQTSPPDAAVNFTFLPYGPFSTVAEFVAWYDQVIRPDIGVVWFAIVINSACIDRNGAEVAVGTFAGTVALLNAESAQRRLELGHLNILPRFQRTFVASHANGLLLNYVLDPPSTGALGLRRVQWFANAANARSITAAERLGFQFEGIMRWHRVLPEGKQGNGKEAGLADGLGPGRDSALLSLCWDDWKDGGRQRIKELLER